MAGRLGANHDSAVSELMRSSPCARQRSHAGMNDNSLKFLRHWRRRPTAAPSPCARRTGAAPGLFWLGGYKSDMKGTKAAGAGRLGGAQAAAPACGSIIPAMANRAALSPTARSAAGSTTASRCSTPAAAGRRSWSARRWAAGSRCFWSAPCGGARKAGAASVAGLVLIAPAVDFTEELMWKRFTPGDQTRA